MSLDLQIVVNIAAAWLAGGLIGVERSYHGRAAGFRTHCIVAIAAAGAVMVSYIPLLQPAVFHGPASIDNAGRIAQGVMTGIGFLGAGVIFREGVNIQGLTTAASVWATAGIGLLFGVGAYVPACAATAAVLASLIVLRWAEMWMPAKIYVWSVFRFDAAKAPTGDGLRALLKEAGVSLGELSYARTQSGTMMEYSGTMVAPRDAVLRVLGERLRGMDGLVEYNLDRISK